LSISPRKKRPVAWQRAPEWVARALTEYFKMFSAGWGDYTTQNVEQLTGHPARSYQTFAQDFSQVFRPQ